MSNVANVTSSIPQTSTGSQTTSASQLNMQQFLVLLSVQLSTQNPLEPMSDRDFFAQMAQLGTVQGMDAMKSTMEASQSAALIGKHVTALRPYTDTSSGLNETAEGTVEKVTIQNGEYKLVIREANGGTVEVSPTNIQTIGEEAASATSNPSS